MTAPKRDRRKRAYPVVPAHGKVRGSRKVVPVPRNRDLPADATAWRYPGSTRWEKP